MKTAAGFRSISGVSCRLGVSVAALVAVVGCGSELPVYDDPDLGGDSLRGGVRPCRTANDSHCCGNSRCEVKDGSDHENTRSFDRDGRDRGRWRSHEISGCSGTLGAAARATGEPRFWPIGCTWRQLSGWPRDHGAFKLIDVLALRLASSDHAFFSLMR